MFGAILVGLAGFYLVKRRSEAFFGGAFHVPTRRDISKPLVVGSFIFGVGWGIAGICPGPAIVVLGTGHLKAFIFLIAMLVGMQICDRFFKAHKIQPK